MFVKRKEKRSCDNARDINPFRAPEPLPVLKTSKSVPKNGFPVVKGLKKSHLKLCPRRWFDWLLRFFFHFSRAVLCSSLFPVISCSFFRVFLFFFPPSFFPFVYLVEKTEKRYL